MHTEESIPELEELPRSKHLNLGTGRCRTGKVARLPKALRDRINQMLRNAVPYQTILDSLGEFGQGINEDNLGNWKKGGYQDWLKEQESIEIIRVKQEFATDLFTDA